MYALCSTLRNNKCRSTEQYALYRVRSIVRLLSVGSPIQTNAIMYLMTASDGVRWQCCLEGPVEANQRKKGGAAWSGSMQFLIRTITDSVQFL